MKRKHLITAIVIAALCALMAVPAAGAATAKPAQVKGVAVKATNATSLKVTWKTVAKAKGYKVRYSKKATMAGAKTVTVTGAKAKSKVLTGLAKCTRYYVQVRAYRTAKVLGKWSAKRNAKTAHAYKQVTGKAATCTTAGWTNYKKCTVCGAVTGKKTTAAKGHTTVTDAAKAATCTCSRCGDSYVDTYTAHVTRENTDAYSWAELKLVSDRIGACETQDAALEVAKEYNLLASDGKLTGDEAKSFTLEDGTACEAQVLGFWHDDKADGSGKAGITFGFKQVVDWCAMNPTDTDSGGWESSSMRTWLNSSFYNQLPSDLRSQIVAVSKMTNNTGETEDAASVTATSDRLWLLSMAECYGTFSDSDDNSPSRPEVYNAEGAQYELYADNGVTTSSCSFLVKYDTTGHSDWWWLRSPDADYSLYFHDVSSYSYCCSGNAGYSLGVSPGFCL